MPEISPFQWPVLERIEQGLKRAIQPGDLGVIMARAGVGKTTFMIRMGLEELRADRGVVHIALGQKLSYVHARYEALLKECGRGKEFPLEARRKLVIQAYSDRALPVERLRKTFADVSQYLQLKPSVILVDGHDWHADSFKPEVLQELVKIGTQAGAAVCLSARTHREASGSHPAQVPEPVRSYLKEIAWAVFLEPNGHRLSARLLYAFGDENPGWEQVFEPLKEALPAKPKKYILLSGGAEGAESFFGECAERYGLEERNFTFESRKTVRQRGLVFLEADQLKQGDVSIAYLKKRMHRSFRDTKDFRMVLQSIWHQVNPAGEVFAVGFIKSDQTVKGGTGWAVELAKHLDKSLRVFDQNRADWFEWQCGEWCRIEPPRVRHSFFTGTGTRSLSEEGRRAISELFSRSFELTG